MRPQPYPKYKPSGVEWLREVPEHWDVKAIKWESPVLRGASPRPIDNDIYFDEKGEYAWVRIADVSAAGMYLHETMQRLSNLGRSLSVSLQPGTLFLSIAGTVGKPCITAIKCCIHDGFVYFPFWCGESRFLYYLFASGESYRGLGKLGTQLNLNTDTVGSIIAGFPESLEQRAIADFLDRETVKIDTLVAKKRTLIERLNEKRAALISRTVTRGLPPDAARAASLDPHPKLKPTGIGWLGEVPEHWDVIPIGRKIVLQRGCDITKDQQQDGGVPVVSSGGVSSFHDEAVVQAPGVVVGRKGTAGAVYYIAVDFWPHDTTLYVREFFRTDVRYAYFKLLSMDLASYDTGSANPTVNRNLVHPVVVSWPPVVEQRAIADFLDRETVRLDTLVTKIETAIERLYEYRAALITAAVTGKIDVRGTVVREEDAA